VSEAIQKPIETCPDQLSRIPMSLTNANFLFMSFTLIVVWMVRSLFFIELPFLIVGYHLNMFGCLRVRVTLPNRVCLFVFCSYFYLLFVFVVLFVVCG